MVRSRRPVDGHQRPIHILQHIPPAIDPLLTNLLASGSPVQAVSWSGPGAMIASFGWDGEADLAVSGRRRRGARSPLAPRGLGSRRRAVVGVDVRSRATSLREAA